MKDTKPKKPRWWNQNYILFLALKSANRPLPRKELIPKALLLDKKIAAERNLPTLFHGKTPKNTASGRLTSNVGKNFVSFIPAGSKVIHFKLAYEPGCFESALCKYEEWTRKLIEFDWPFFFKGQFEDEEKPVLGIVAHHSTDQGTITNDQTSNNYMVINDSKSFKINTKKEYKLPRSLSELLEKKPSTIPNAGNGLFATQDIPKHTFLGFYFGVPMSEDEFDALKANVGQSEEYCIRYRNNILDPTDENGILYDICPFVYMNENRKMPNIAFIEGMEVNQVDFD